LPYQKAIFITSAATLILVAILTVTYLNNSSFSRNFLDLQHRNLTGIVVNQGASHQHNDHEEHEALKFFINAKIDSAVNQSLSEILGENVSRNQ
jgi:hypothetical protein